jgi:hypothetical protein
MKYKEIVPKVNAILKQYEYPLTLRQVYYRLVAEDGGIDNTRSNYNSLSKILVKARERGEVDYRQIEDRVRSTAMDHYALPGPVDLYGMMANHIEYAASKYRRNPWLDQDNYVEVWLEKDALSTVVSRIATKVFCVPVAVNRGYGSFSFIREGAERIESNDKSLHILYFGDFDPSGEDMVRDLQKRIVQYGKGERIATVHKIALTKAQIRQYNVPESLAKEKDKRTKAFIEKHGSKTAELDAIEPRVLQEMVKTAIEEYISPPLWNESIDKSSDDMQQINEMVSKIKRCISEAVV